MELPLLRRASANDPQFQITPVDARPATSCGHGAGAPSTLTPGRLPMAGEQYRFHLEMSKCIGCKCCVVACNEQNGNPPGIQWRRVGEIEGGIYPDTARRYLSMGCNHCLEPTCLEGCPVNAYTKDSLTGIVLHDANRCIGCQYCTWNCSYGVPQYNPERGVVGKCDMCHGRLSEGREPACVTACPEEAIRIEIVNVDKWRSEYAAHANAPGLPSADDSLSTTRITSSTALPPDTDRVDTAQVRPEHAHWTLILMTVFTRLSVGAIASMAAAQLFTGATVARIPAAAVALTALLGLSASTLHLGRPIYAYRALSMWRRSWLSREVLGFSLFASASIAYAALLWIPRTKQILPMSFIDLLMRAHASLAAGMFAALVGAAAIYASARLYTVPARPMWKSRHTFLEFNLGASLTGMLAVSLFTPAVQTSLTRAACCAALAILTQQVVKFVQLWRAPVFELRASAELVRFRFPRVYLFRFCGLVALPVVLLAAHPHLLARAMCVALAIGLELVGRWLFFVAVVPKNMADTYLREREAA